MKSTPRRPAGFRAEPECIRRASADVLAPSLRAPRGESWRRLGLLSACFGLGTWLLACGNGSNDAGADTGGSTNDSAGSTGSATGSTGASGSTSAGSTSASGPTSAGSTNDSGGTASGSSDASGATSASGSTGGSASSSATSSDGGSGATSASGSTGSGSTGSATAGGSDGGLGLGGPSLCAGKSYLLCESFEDTPVGDTPPAGWTRHGNASVADDDAARGSHSLKVAAATNGERRFYYSMASRFGSGHWGRIFYKVQVPVPDPFVHSTLVALYGTGPTVGPAEYRVVDTVKNQGAGAMHQFLYNVQPSGAEFATGSSYVYQFDGKWHCAEWHIAGPTQTYRFYYDSKEVTSIGIENGAGNYNGSDIPDSFSDLRVGWNNYQAADPGFVAWIDEVAIDANRIGCAN